MPAPAEIVESLRRALDARAAGLWRLDAGRLDLVAFAPAPDLAADVAAGFPEATRSVPLDQVDLGIVAAAVGRRPVASRADDLPPDAGSGRWLRAFGAGCSVAVPLSVESGRVAAVLSVALPGDPRDDDAIAEEVRRFARLLDISEGSG